MLRLHYLPANQRFVFTFGDGLIRMGDGPMFFETRDAAVAAAAERRLTVTDDGRVTS